MSAPMITSRQDRLVMALIRLIAKVLGRETAYDAEVARLAAMSADEMRLDTSAKLVELQKVMMNGDRPNISRDKVGRA